MRFKAGSARCHFDFVGDDERGVKTNPELADEPGVVLFIAGHLLQEFGCPRFCNRANIFDQLVARHSDAVIRNGKRLVRGVERYFDLQLRSILH